MLRPEVRHGRTEDGELRIPALVLHAAAIDTYRIAEVFLNDGPRPLCGGSGADAAW